MITKCKYCMGDLKNLEPSTDFQCEKCNAIFDIDDLEE